MPPYTVMCINARAASTSVQQQVTPELWDLRAKCVSYHFSGM